MVVLRKEEEIQDFLAEKLRKMSFFEEVYSRINLASRRYYEHWERWWVNEYPPYAQPDIDLLLVDRYRRLLAIEVKYFKPKQVTYYAGIEQGLALLNFGFFSVSLWHCFSDEISLGEIERCGYNTSELIRVLKLPLNFSAISVTKVGERFQFKEIKPGFSSEDSRLPSPYGTKNPLRNTERAKRAEEFLRMALKIPHPESSVEEKLKAIRRKQGDL